LGAGAGLELEFFLRIQKNQIPKITAAITATPPTAPPTMAPMGVDFPEAGVGVGGGVGEVNIPIEGPGGVVVGTAGIGDVVV
jgi:hypothetical protein